MAKNSSSERRTALPASIDPRCSRCRGSLVEDLYCFEVLGPAGIRATFCAGCTATFLRDLARANDAVDDELGEMWAGSR